MVRLTDRELCGVDADREPARARVQVIARERALASFVQDAVGCERQWVRGNRDASAKARAH